MLSSSGSSSRLSGRSIFLHLDTFLARNLMWRHQTLSTKQTFFCPKIYKYALTAVDVASHYKEAEPLTSKDSAEVAKAFQSIYRRSSLTWPQMLQVDPGHAFMGRVYGKPQNIHLPRPHSNSQRSGHCRVFQPHACRAPFWPSVCRGNAFA